MEGRLLEKIKITEVGPRDGLQNESKIIPTESKKEFIRLLESAGLRHIEATSFVSPRAIPQLSDAKALAELLHLKEPRFTGNTNFSCLTPNTKGYEQALESGFREVAVFTAVSESFTKKNINKTVDESMDSFQDIFRMSQIDKVKVRGYISTVIACPYEGWVEPSRVLDLVSRLLDRGVYEISLGETIGKATPVQVEKLLSLLLEKYPPHVFAVHFHDTYGMAIANIQKSIEMGIRSFDSSAGGLGGCPYAKGAAGNVATEDLVYLLDTQGFDTEISLPKLAHASSYMQNILEKPLPSKTFQAIAVSNG